MKFAIFALSKKEILLVQSQFWFSNKLTKLFLVFAAFIAIASACNFGCTGHAPVCATDLRTRNPQNFNNICRMREENCRGGRELKQESFQ